MRSLTHSSLYGNVYGRSLCCFQCYYPLFTLYSLLSTHYPLLTTCYPNPLIHRYSRSLREKPPFFNASLTTAQWLPHITPADLLQFRSQLEAVDAASAASARLVGTDADVSADGPYSSSRTYAGTETETVTVRNIAAELEAVAESTRIRSREAAGTLVGKTGNYDEDNHELAVTSSTAAEDQARALADSAQTSQTVDEISLRRTSSATVVQALSPYGNKEKKRMVIEPEEPGDAARSYDDLTTHCNMLEFENFTLKEELRRIRREQEKDRLRMTPPFF